MSIAGRKRVARIGLARYAGWICGILLFGDWVGAARADTTYVLDPGATITPLSGATKTGNPEALTGSFVWKDAVIDGNTAVFDATSLNFVSHSFTLTLDTSPANNFASDTFQTGGSYFVEIVDGTGFSQTLLSLQPFLTMGSYTGTFNKPTQVTYQDLRIRAVLGGGTGGATEASLTFSATAVPEPSLALLVLGALPLLRRDRRSGSSRAAALLNPFASQNLQSKLPNFVGRDIATRVI